MGTEAAAIGVTDEDGLLARLYAKHVPKVTRIVFLMTGDAEVARELTHDAYLRTSRRIHLLRDQDAFGAYMTRTAINLSKRYRDRRRRERELVEREASLAPRSAVQPDLETRDEMTTMLRRLPHRQRAALVLRFYADLPDAEIADLLGAPTGTVRSLISRGLATLRRELGEHS